MRTFNHLKTLKRLGVKGVQPQENPSALLITKELTSTTPEKTSRWTDYPRQFVYHLKQLIGLRTLKTGLAIFLALLISNSSFISNPFYVAMGTVFALQSTVKNSFAVGRERLMGTLIGGFMGFLFACLPWQNFPLVAFAAILTIVFCNQTKNTKAISISITICLSILISIEDQHPLTYSFFRMTDTGIGLLIGILINYFVARPDYSTQMKYLLEHFYQTSQGFFYDLLFHRPINLSDLKEELALVDQMATKYLEDSVNPTIETTTICELLDAAHDLRFYLKGLHLLLEEGYEIEGNDQLQLEAFLSQLPYYPAETSRPTLRLQSEPLIRYHLEKISDSLYHVQLQLAEFN